ncbi:MAG: hypothetical protein C4K49_11805 [Candidatus Thorarchaeota archaeon]|nr:MAG: hypothetical protein C4K49_11805 [Candidatus Thorarchaeota archaeon]
MVSIVKLFYHVDPSVYRERMDKVRQQFSMHEEVDEDKTILLLEDKSKIELVTGSYDPRCDEKALVRVVLVDKKLKDFFDSVFGTPYMIKQA